MRTFLSRHRFAMVGLAGLVVAVVAGNLLFGGREMTSASMEPTISAGDRFDYDAGSPDLGDVIAYRVDPEVPYSPCEEQRGAGDERVCVARQPVEVGEASLFLGRVVAGGGQRVEMRDGRLYVDGEPEEGDYETRPCGARARCDFAPIVVPEEHLFVLGDNRGGAKDSRYLGYVSELAVEGIVEL